MNNINMLENEREKVIEKVCSFLEMDIPPKVNVSIKDAIKEICVARLCRAVGITGKYNSKSDFFDFFASIMGEAICEKLSIKIQIACDELRLVKYEHVNLIRQVKEFLDTECVEEAFLDAFELADRFKWLIPKLKKV